MSREMNIKGDEIVGDYVSLCEAQKVAACWLIECKYNKLAGAFFEACTWAKPFVNDLLAIDVEDIKHKDVAIVERLSYDKYFEIMSSTDLSLKKRDAESS